MGAKVRAYPTFDEAANTVSFNIEMVAGRLYQLSTLDLQGLETDQKKRLSSIWKLNVGDVYDPSYAATFIEKNLSRLAFLNGYSLSWNEKVNDEASTVELAVFFRKPGASRTQ